MPIVHIGSDSEYVAITFPSLYSAEGWAQAVVEISVNCFRGEIHPFIEAKDIEHFAKQLRTLYEKLTGEAEFFQSEGQFSLRIVSTGGGRMHLTGEAWSQAAHENKLEFQLELDQSYLPKPLSVLEALVHTGEKK